jgi:hypothetical protein
MDLPVLAPTLLAAVAGAVLAFGVDKADEPDGPADRVEATVEARANEPAGREGHVYRLVLRTASGERFEVRGSDQNLDLEPGSPVRAEISEAGKVVRAVEANDHRVRTEPLGAMAWSVLVFGFLLVVYALGSVRLTRHPALATLSATAGLAVGALPVVLLF